MEAQSGCLRLVCIHPLGHLRGQMEGGTTLFCGNKETMQYAIKAMGCSTLQARDMYVIATTLQEDAYPKDAVVIV